LPFLTSLSIRSEVREYLSILRSYYKAAPRCAKPKH